VILDSSAIVALVMDEPGADGIERALAGAARVGVGAPTLLETSIVLSARLGRDARPLLHRLLRVLDAEIVVFDEGQFECAMDGWTRYGKGRHPAALNYGDCLAYGTAKGLSQPLLCVGDDFPRTDLDLVPT